MKKVLCLGDSLTDCDRLFSEDPLGNGYVSMLNASPENSAKTFTFINRGVDGFTISRLLDNARSQYVSIRPDLITILIGVNDLSIMMNTNRTEAQKQALMNAFFQKYEQLLQILIFSVREIILMEPFLFPYPEEFAAWEPIRRKMTDGIRILSEHYPVTFLPLQDTLITAAKSEGFSSITIDGVHLTQKGQALVAAQLKPLIYRSDL